MRGQSGRAAALLPLSFLAALSTLSCGDRGEVVSRAAASGPTGAAATPAPKLPEGLTVEEVTALVEASDAFREPKVAKCPKSVDHHNLPYWHERYPALGVFLSQGLVELSEPGSDPTGYQTVRLTPQGQSPTSGITEDAGNYLVTIATRRLVDIRSLNPRGNGRYDLTIDWQFVPTEIGKAFRLGTQIRGTWVTLEQVGGTWRVDDVQLNNGPYLPDDY